MLVSAALSTVLLVSGAYAGGQTVEPMPQDQNPTLFATLEGGYTWNELNATTVNGVTANQSNSGGTGRFAIGGIHQSTMHPNLSYTAEVGAGYYGQTDYTAPVRGINAQNYIYGFDVLGGVDYKFCNMFDLFFKVGGLMENVRMNHSTDLSKYVGDGTVVGIDNSKTTISSVIPEIKVGGIYDITNAWGLSAAYMHAFGNNVSMVTSRTAVGGVITSNSSAIGSPITLNTLTFGVVYKFN